jgi:DNA (cytosine-5)-methyltransferase 1
MRFGSVCSGIEAASVAWDPLGWDCAFVSEIEKFPSAVLAHRFPAVPNLGDFTKIGADHVGAVDVLVGGTPCQDFSVAGLRAGLAGDRGALTVAFVGLLSRLRPRWMVWENVPGVLSADDGRAFGLFLGMLGELGYGFAYRVLDAQFFGVPQRRRRVFVVGYLGDWRRAAAVLFERSSLSGDSPPRRKAGPIATRVAGDGAGNGVTQALTIGLASGGPDAQHAEAGWLVAFDTTQITSAANYSNPKPGDACHPLAAGAHVPAIAFQTRGSNLDVGDVSGTIGSNADCASGGAPMIAFECQGNGDGAVEELSPTMRARDCVSKPGGSLSIATASAVRRLTPRECERLQGFPDDWTLVPYRGKPAADGPRYRSLGNSMAVPVMRWIGDRIAMADGIVAA